MDVFATFALIPATISMGLMAGLFGHYAHTIMPALRHTDDQTFVRAFQAIDRKIINPWMLAGGYFPALIFTALTVVAQISGDERAALPWTAAALLLYLGVVGITVRVHVPRNNMIKAVGDPDGVPDLAAVRSEFDEAKWARWNVVRALATTAAFACLTWALVQSASP